jgi:hypothetical protein
MKLRRSLYARPVIVRGEQCAEARLGRWSDTEQLPGRCRGSGDPRSVPSPSRHWLRAHKRRLHGNGSASQRVILVWCGGGCPTTATPFVALSGPRVPCPTVRCPLVRWTRVRVHVSGDGCAGVRYAGVRCPRVSGPPPPCRRRGGFVERVARGADRSWSAGERPAADRQPRLDGDHESGWAPCRPAQQSAGVVSSGQPSHAWKRRDAPWFPAQPDGFARSSGSVVWRRTRC